MNRRRMARVALSCCALAAAMLTTAHADNAGPKTRSFHLEYKAVISKLPPGAKRVELWFPVPHDDEFQTIRNVQIESPTSYEIRDAVNGNRMLHVRMERPRANGFAVTLSLDATRKEHIQSRLYAPNSSEPLSGDDEQDVSEYLKPDRLVPLNDEIRRWAHEVVESAGARTPLEMARAIYSHVVATVKYDKSGKGWGRGDIYYACEERRGNCTDFHAIVIGYARAVEIPARFAIGLPLPADRGQGKIAGYHCWAELYVRGIGWIPIDASEAAKNPVKREYFFGAHDENRLELSKGRDVVLAPAQHGEPLNYFIYPYAEVDGQPYADVTMETSYHDASDTAMANRKN